MAWLRNGTELKPSEDFRFENAGDVYKLVIGEVFPEDSGVYCCEAVNTGGTALSECTIYVQGKHMLSSCC